MFVVDKDATIFHFRWALNIFPCFYIDIVAFLNRYIGPIIPRRYTYFFRDVIDSIDCSAFVATSNDQIVVHCLDKEWFPFTSDWRYINFLFSNELVNDFTLTDRSDNYSSLSNGNSFVKFGRHSRDFLYILCQICHCPFYTFPVRRVNIYVCSFLVLYYGENIPRFFRYNILGE